MKNLIWRLTLLAVLSGMIFWESPVLADGKQVPEDIYEHVQSTARADYYFNRKAMEYRVDSRGIIDLNQIYVPALRIYDNVQIEDVIAKRRWKMLSLKGYDTLCGAADYLLFDLKAQTVKLERRDYLDGGWGVLDTEKGGDPKALQDFSEKDVDGVFYRAILKYVTEHRFELIDQTEGTLSEQDAKMIEKEKKAAEKARKKAEKARLKAEKERLKAEKKRQREEQKKAEAERKRAETEHRVPEAVQNGK